VNQLEREMLEILAEGKERYGWLAVKAEFEAEGTRLDELTRLVDLVRRSGLKLALKIGGCEALTDLYNTRLTGADYVIAPMVESGFALSKYVSSIRKAYSISELADTKFLWNLETFNSMSSLDAYRSNLDEGVLSGVVFGRSDFLSSMALETSDTDDLRVLESCLDVAEWCKTNDLEMVVGGGVSISSVPNLRRIREVRLSRFETRKVIFDANSLDLEEEKIATGMLNALKFELKWLENKANYYSGIVEQDANRTETLKARWGL